MVLLSHLRSRTGDDRTAPTAFVIVAVVEVEVEVKLEVEVEVELVPVGGRQVKASVAAGSTAR